MDFSTFAAVGFAMIAGHSFGDHWVQTGFQAMNKGRKDKVGRLACRGHVFSLQTTKLVLILVLMLAGLSISPLALVAGLAFDGITHYWCDRRFTLEGVCGRIGKADFYQMGKDTIHEHAPNGTHLGTGAYALDQSFHMLMIFIASLIIAL